MTRHMRQPPEGDNRADFAGRPVNAGVASAALVRQNKLLPA